MEHAIIWQIRDLHRLLKSLDRVDEVVIDLTRWTYLNHRGLKPLSHWLHAYDVVMNYFRAKSSSVTVLGGAGVVEALRLIPGDPPKRRATFPFLPFLHRSHEVPMPRSPILSSINQSPITAVSIQDNPYANLLGKIDIPIQHIVLPLLSRATLNTPRIYFKDLVQFLQNHPGLTLLQLGGLIDEGTLFQKLPPDILPNLTHLAVPARLVPDFLSSPSPKLEKLTILETLAQRSPHPDLTEVWRPLAASIPLHLQLELAPLETFDAPVLSPFYQQHVQSLSIIVQSPAAYTEPNDIFFRWLAKFARLSRVTVAHAMSEEELSRTWKTCCTVSAACRALGENVRFVRKEHISWRHTLAFDTDFWKP